MRKLEENWLAARGACVLITGESGTGKALDARDSSFSPRREGPFLSVHVAALNPNLVKHTNPKGTRK